MKQHNAGNEIYTCPICQATLNSKKSYMKHERVHYEEGFKCEICSKVFTRQDALKYHHQVVHEKNEVSIN